ncbi:MAG: hypothetical protein ABW073_01030 [Acidimicrobiia bacterium]
MALVDRRVRRSGFALFLLALVLALACGMGVAAASDSMVASHVGSSPAEANRGARATSNGDAVLVSSGNSRVPKNNQHLPEGALLAALGAVSGLAVWHARRARGAHHATSASFAVHQRGPPVLQFA